MFKVRTTRSIRSSGKCLFVAWQLSDWEEISMTSKKHLFPRSFLPEREKTRLKHSEQEMFTLRIRCPRCLGSLLGMQVLDYSHPCI